MKLYRLFFFCTLVCISQMSLAQNMMSDWDGVGATGAGSEPNNFKWGCTPSIEWTEANVLGVRFQDDVSYLYNEDTVTGRVLFVRWDGVKGANNSSVYSYPIDLDACKTYVLKAKIAWHSVGRVPAFTYQVNGAKDNSGTSLAKEQLVVSSKGVLRDIELVFTTDESGVYYFTLGANSAVLGGIRDLSLTRYSDDPVLLATKKELIYDSLHLSQSFHVSGYGLTENITFSAPKGMTITPKSITPKQAKCLIELTASFDDADALTSGAINMISGTLRETVKLKKVLPPYLAAGTAEFTPDGTWCWFQDPRALYYEGAKKQTYSGWVTSDGSVQVGSYNHVTGEITVHTLHEKFQIDDHNNPTFLIREDGHILVAYSGHFYGPMRVMVSERPEDITSFGPEATFGDNVTYANPYQIGDSTVMFYRDGTSWHPTMNVSLDGGVTWGAPQEFITRRGTHQRPYVKYTQDSKGGMHITFTTGHPRQEQSNAIYYVYFKNKKFYKADGTLIKSYNGTSDALDIDAGEAEVVYDASLGKGWTWDIALDEKEHPVILYAAFPNDLNHHYYYAKWDEGQWSNHHITNSGRWFPQTPVGAGEPEPNYSGGMALDPNDPKTVYLSKQVNAIFELFKYTTNDGGKSWETEQITRNSPAGVMNVRPVVPRNHLPGSFDVMWMRGKYITYANYLTSVMYYSSAP